MTDILTKKQRSYNMSRVKCSKTKPELRLKPVMKMLGFAYQPKIYGRPDFASKKLKIAVFVDGCFWHKCHKHFKAPKQNAKFWRAKIAGNVVRDREVTEKLRKLGWTVMRVWEHNVRKLK